MVAHTKTRRGGQEIDLRVHLSGIARDGLVLRPNDSDGELPTFDGATMTDAAWDRACRQAMRQSSTSQVATSRRTPVRLPVDLLRRRGLPRTLTFAGVKPQAFLGKVQVAQPTSAPRRTYRSSPVTRRLFILESRWTPPRRHPPAPAITDSRPRF